MENTHAHPTTKDDALRQLGVTSKKARKALMGQVEFVQVAAGRPLVSRGRVTPTVLVGVAGSVLISSTNGHVAQVEAPFVVDTWAADERRIAEVTVLAEANTTLVLVDVQRRESVFNAVPTLVKLSASTQTQVAEANNQPLDLTDLVDLDPINS